MLCGLPASGKSFYAKQLSSLYNLKIHSSDEIRKELYGDENIQDKNNEVFQLLHKRVKDDLLSGYNVCYDATNINYKRRKAFLDEIKKIDCDKICAFMSTPYQDCLQNNAKRERSISEDVITRMYKNFYIPQYYEGWDQIKIVWNFNDKHFNLNELFNGKEGLNYISQDNPNHSLTIGKHCLMCNANLEKINPNSPFTLFKAALLHDIGKKFCKSFKNSEGKLTKEAHYYQHHLVSAYNSLFYLKSEGCYDDEFILETCNYIQWHMQPYFMKTEKQRKKYKKLWGEEFYNNLMILNEADKSAK